jgi:hypothetical protein
MEQLKDSAQMIGALVGFASAIAITSFYVVGINKDLRNEVDLAKKDIAVAEERAKNAVALAIKDIALVEERAQKETALVEERAKAEIANAKVEIANAKKENAERFLLYGYAAEYIEYQNRLKLGEHGKAESAEK